MKIDIGDLAKAVMDGLEEYAGAVADDIKAAAKQTADDCAKELKSTSPRKTGSYAKGWKVKKAYENGVMARYTVYNATDYQLTHLLEKGHAKRGGGRVAAIPHIEPAEQKAIEEFEKAAKEACKQ